MEIKVKTIPNSSQSEILLQTDGSLKIKVKTSPIKGKANDEIIKLLAKYYKTAKSKITITKGKTAKNKLIKIEN